MACRDVSAALTGWQVINPYGWEHSIGTTRTRIAGFLMRNQPSLGGLLKLEGENAF